MQPSLSRTIALILGAAILVSNMPARADLVEDWLAARAGTGAPVTYAEIGRAHV